MLAGWGRAYARQNQMLPYSGASITEIETEQLRRHLEERALNAKPSETAAAALLSAILTTGRSAATLATLPVVTGTGTVPRAPCLQIGSQWVWWLEPGRPESQQKFSPGHEPADAKRGDLVALPCSIRTRRLLEQMSTAPTPNYLLFPLQPVAVEGVTHREIRKAGVASSLRLVESWLFQRLTKMPTGDAALAAIITGNVPLIAKTVIHYTSICAPTAVGMLVEALEGFDAFNPSFRMVSVDRLGSRYAPPVEKVIDLLIQVRRPLLISRKRRKKPISAMHNAMTIYTALFYLIATCARPTRRMLPSLDAIDPLTGYQILDDKPASGNFKARLIWVSEDCQEQLRRYQAHLATMRERYPDLAPPDEDGSPYLISDDGSLEVLDRRLLRRAMSAEGWAYPVNFARHFVRSELVGKVSSETLHAFFGHWHQGTEPWSEYAGLDPLAYRAELQNAIALLCAKCGLEPQRGL